ncbi:MAG: hypothetical protein QOI95_2934 [Acidimicrobiaceae bacterium]|jgi:hypothetical protein
MLPDHLDADVETRAEMAAEHRRRARSAAQGIGTTFAGAALVIASMTATIAAPLLVVAVGIAVSIAIFRRRIRTIASQLGDPEELLLAADGSPFIAVAAALADLRREAAATDAVLRRVRQRGTPL